MTSTVLGKLEVDGTLLYIEERPPDAPQHGQFKVQLKVDASQIDLDLDAIRRLKRMLAEGERALLHRHDQAMRARNLQLDL